METHAAFGVVGILVLGHPGVMYLELSTAVLADLEQEFTRRHPAEDGH